MLSERLRRSVLNMCVDIRVALVMSTITLSHILKIDNTDVGNMILVPTLCFEAFTTQTAAKSMPSNNSIS
jgi:hypothetical protein